MGKLPEVVYKYRVWENSAHKNILLHNELYMASPKDFNDPFDCRIPPNVSLLSDLEKSQYVTHLAVKHFPDAIERNIDLNKAIPDLENRIFSGSIQQEIDQIEFESSDNYFGILSLSCRWNSVLLWSHYSYLHEGFCIGFFEEKLRNSLINWPVGMGIMKYAKDFPKIKPKVFDDYKDIDLMKRRFDKFLVKSIDWKYEAEYRIFINYFPRIPKPYERIIIFPAESIAEIIIGMKMFPTNREEIVSICQKRGIRVFQAKKSPFKFEIVKEEIK